MLSLISLLYITQWGDDILPGDQITHNIKILNKHIRSTALSYLWFYSWLEKNQRQRIGKSMQKNNNSWNWNTYEQKRGNTMRCCLLNHSSAVCLHFIFIEQHIWYTIRDRKFSTSFWTYQITVNNVNFHQDVMNFFQKILIIFVIFRQITG